MIHNTLDGSTRRYTFEATDFEDARRKMELNRKACDCTTNFMPLDDIDYMYNIDGDTAEIHTRVNGDVDVYIENAGKENHKEYGNVDAAVRCLRRMGFEF
jgi:hypothetical protein